VSCPEDVKATGGLGSEREPPAMINLNQLRGFFHTAKHLSFTAAAKELFITQPAVTAQVKLFEEYCGLKLFKKKRGRLFLTEEGKAIYTYAAKLFENEREIEVAVREMKKLKRGTLRLGTARTYGRYFAPFLISHFRASHPHIKIHLDEGSSHEMIRKLLNLRIEVAIIARVEDNPELCFLPFAREELALILSPDHPLAGKKAVSFDALAREPMIMKETGSGTRWLVNDLFSRNRCSPRVLMETSDAEIIKLMVQHGEGVSFLVREAVARELKEGKLVTIPITGHGMLLDVSIGYLKHQPLSPPGQAFITCVEELGTKGMGPQGIGSLMAGMAEPKD
jgi:DNA-binding transcriptional LysR family regulator